MTTWTDDFLIDLDPSRWTAPGGFPKAFTPAGLFTQPGANGLEVLLATAANRPAVADLRKAWGLRRAKRASPVLLVVGYPADTSTRVAVCGPVGDQPPVHVDIDVSQAERLAATALREPNHHAATRFLLATLPGSIRRHRGSATSACWPPTSCAPACGPPLVGEGPPGCTASPSEAGQRPGARPRVRRGRARHQRADAHCRRRSKSRCGVPR